LNVAKWSWNSVWPVGVLAPFLYCELKPKLARPDASGSAAYEPFGEISQPPPVTKPPPFGS
jgi:hypothetical protein